VRPSAVGKKEGVPLVAADAGATGRLRMLCRRLAESSAQYWDVPTEGLATAADPPLAANQESPSALIPT
jgi:hypothetical protein